MKKGGADTESEDTKEILSGNVEDIIFCSEQTGFTVLDICTDDEKELVTAVGSMPDAVPGEHIVMQGTWSMHPSFGRQFRAESCEHSVPSTAAQMLRYLSSGIISGVGPSTASSIVEKFGSDTFSIIENSPDSLAVIKGISKEKAAKISRQFLEKKASRTAVIELETLGLTPDESLRAFRHLGNHAAARVEQDPYVLCVPEIGAGFERADSIAQSLPVKPAPECRIDAGLVHICTYNLSNGHTCLPRSKMLAPAAQLLGITESEADIALDRVCSKHALTADVHRGTEYISLPFMRDAEYNSAKQLSMRIKFPPAGSRTTDSDIEDVEHKAGIEYANEQKLALKTAASRGILILTGGPGTGKTTAINGIISLFEKQGLNTVLTAPTGRAAQRMSEITGREAQTIHRLLEAGHETDGMMSFKKNASDPIKADALIVDELSMVDSELFAALTDAMPLGCRLIMVGDSDQLPAVGAGNVLHDLIQGNFLPVVKLDKIFRQALTSTIVRNAHLIVSGQMPDLTCNSGDFFHMERNDGQTVASDITSLYTVRLPKAYGYDPKRDIQVLCATKKGPAGSFNLNRILQQAVNPPDRSRPEIVLKSRTLRTGDKIMQTRNNYDISWTKSGTEGLGIFNGDIGYIISIDKRAGIMKADFDGKIASFPLTSLEDIQLAYAVTVHKSQGSEFRAVIMPVIDIPPQLSYRNLFYTAVTRARDLMVTVGRRSEVGSMVENDRRIKRYTSLKYFMEESV